MKTYKIKCFDDLTIAGYGKSSRTYKINGIEYQTTSKKAAKKLCNKLTKKQSKSMYITTYTVIKE